MANFKSISFLLFPIFFIFSSLISSFHPLISHPLFLSPVMIFFPIFPPFFLSPNFYFLYFSPSFFHFLFIFKFFLLFHYSGSNGLTIYWPFSPSMHANSNQYLLIICGLIASFSHLGQSMIDLRRLVVIHQYHSIALCFSFNLSLFCFPSILKSQPICNYLNALSFFFNHSLYSFKFLFQVFIYYQPNFFSKYFVSFLLFFHFDICISFIVSHLLTLLI